MGSRINLGKATPDAYKAVLGLEQAASAAAKKAGLADGLTHLLRLRASQINQCAFCVKMHAADALKAGEPIERLSVLPAWRETEYFTPKERAALALTEAVTLVSTGQVPDEVYESAAQELSGEELAAVEWIAIVINTWNRVAIASRYEVGPS